MRFFLTKRGLNEVNQYYEKCDWTPSTELSEIMLQWIDALSHKLYKMCIDNNHKSNYLTKVNKDGWEEVKPGKFLQTKSAEEHDNTLVCMVTDGRGK